MEKRFDEVDRRFEHVDQRFASMQQQIERSFAWLVGITISGFVAVIGALVGIAYR